MKKVILVLGLIVMCLNTLSFAKTYKGSEAHTQLLFRFHHSGVAYTYGRFNELAAIVKYDENELSDSSIQLEVATSSIDVGVGATERLNEELTGPDFFNSVQFPIMSFTSKAVKAGQNNSLEVTGDLSLLGVTKEITVTVQKTGQGENFEGKEVIGFHTEFDIDRAEFGMTNLLEASNGGKIHIIFSFEGVLEG